MIGLLALQSDASSTESSDFVHFDEAQVSYHHRRETSQPGEDIEKDEERVVDGKEEEERHERLQEELECPTSEVLTEEINGNSQLQCPLPSFWIMLWFRL